MRWPPTRHESFVIRLSAEPECDGTSTRWVWRGEIEYTLTSQSWRFVSLDELPRILKMVLQDPSKDVDDLTTLEP